MSDEKLIMNDSSEQYRKLADFQFEINRYGDASKLYELSLKSNNNNIKTLNNFAVLLEEIGDDKKAEQLYKKACMSSEIPEVEKFKLLQNLASIQIKNEHFNAALWTYQSATKIEGFSKNTIAQNYLDLLYTIHIKSFDPEIFSSLSKLYQINETDKNALTKIYLSQLALKLNKINAPTISRTQLALQIIETDEDAISIISNYLITNHIIEKTIISIRKLLTSAILMNTYAAPHTEFLTAINKQCKLNRFIYPVDQEDLLNIEQLTAKIQTLSPQTRIDATLIIDSYFNICKTDNICKFPPIDKTGTPKFNQLKKLDTQNLTETVRAFYESNPYPAWTSKPRTTNSSLNKLFKSLNMNNPPTCNNNILVAGCGTGRHAIQLAMTYPDANIIALDISKTSLEYGSQKRDEYNIKNLEFIHGDLNSTHSLGISFSLIECIGVLHHLNDPLKGFQAILSTLCDSGIAKIGLYSSSARAPIAELKCLTIRNEISYEQDNLEKIRELAIQNYNHGRISEIVNSADFFSRSGCMDLLFHPLEKTYSTTDIYTLIQKLKCEFAGFEKGGTEGSPAFRKFDNPTNIESLFNEWKLFENSNPSFFSEMYLFWLKPIRTKR
jgi:SAM-dependent methyltransferase